MDGITTSRLMLRGFQNSDYDDLFEFLSQLKDDEFEGKVIAVYHRKNDNEDKWIVSLDGKDYSDAEILDAIRFQEQYFKGELVR